MISSHSADFSQLGVHPLSSYLCSASPDHLIAFGANLNVALVYIASHIGHRSVVLLDELRYRPRTGPELAEESLVDGSALQEVGVSGSTGKEA